LLVACKARALHHFLPAIRELDRSTMM